MADLHRRFFPHLHDSPSQFHAIIHRALHTPWSRRERPRAFLRWKMHLLPGRKDGTSRLPRKEGFPQTALLPILSRETLREKTANKSFINVRDHLGHSPASMKGLCLSVTGYSIMQSSPQSHPLVRLIPGQQSNSTFRHTFTPSSFKCH